MERRGYQYQRAEFPEGAEVEAIVSISQSSLGDPLLKGTKGVVTGHCDDGRAWVSFDGFTCTVR